MKKLLAIIVSFLKWIVSIFSIKEIKKKLAVVNDKLVTVDEPVKQRIIPQHNNRKNTKGRFVQYINMGEGRTRSIYHSPAGFQK